MRGSRDAGYHSEENLDACEEAEIEAYIPSGREAHYWDVAERINPPEEASEIPCGNSVERMKARLGTPEGREIFARRKCTIEPVFGVIKAVMGFRQFLLRGLPQVRHEWELVCIAWNLKRLHRLMPDGLRKSPSPAIKNEKRGHFEMIPPCPFLIGMLAFLNPTDC